DQQDQHRQADAGEDRQLLLADVLLDDAVLGGCVANVHAFPVPAAAFRRCGLALVGASAMPTARGEFRPPIQRFARTATSGKVSADSSRTLRIAGHKEKGRKERLPRPLHTRPTRPPFFRTGAKRGTPARPSPLPSGEGNNKLRPFPFLVHPCVVDAHSNFQQHVEPDTIARLKGGDLTAFESVYRQFERAAWTLALRLTGRADVAQEVLQDSMLKAFERARQYRGDAPFAAWLRKL